jgi:GT2 family glycosyltransferase
MTAPQLSIGITTRDRPAALLRCLQSLTRLERLNPDVIVFDDASAVRVTEVLRDAALTFAPRVLRDDAGPGYIAGRNRLAQAARSPAILMLDDDAVIATGEAIERGLEVLAADPDVAAIGFAQSRLDGTRWDDRMQPSQSRVACRVASFIGFAHLLRLDAFAGVGGYRESFVTIGEEKDLCLRLIDAGYSVVYLPDAEVVHEPDPGGRSKLRFLRYTTRNDALNALYNEPWHRAAWLVPARFALYFKMRRAWGVSDPWGWAWVAREVASQTGALARDRRPVSAATRRTWKRLRREPEPYVDQQPGRGDGRAATGDEAS